MTGTSPPSAPYLATRDLDRRATTTWGGSSRIRPTELPIGALGVLRCVYYQLVPEQPPGLPPPVPTAHVRVTVPLTALSVKASPVEAAVEVSV